MGREAALDEARRRRAKSGWEAGTRTHRRSPARKRGGIRLSTVAELLAGGRRWWAHFALTRMNVGPIILSNQIEDLMESWDWRDLLARIDHVTSSGRRAVVSDAC